MSICKWVGEPDYVPPWLNLVKVSIEWYQDIIIIDDLSTLTQVHLGDALLVLRPSGLLRFDPPALDLPQHPLNYNANPIYWYFYAKTFPFSLHLMNHHSHVPHWLNWALHQCWYAACTCSSTLQPWSPTSSSSTTPRSTSTTSSALSTPMIQSCRKAFCIQGWNLTW